MQISKASRRYASALLQIAVEQKKLDLVLDDVDLINNTIADSRELQLMFRSPVIKFDDKLSIVTSLFKDRVSDITFRFLMLLIKKNREDLTEEIFSAFIEEYHKYAGILKIKITSAGELTDDQLDKLKKVFEEKTGKKILVDITIDKKLRGGIAVRVNDTVIDGTVKHKLEQLERLFAGTTV